MLSALLIHAQASASAGIASSSSSSSSSHRPFGDVAPLLAAGVALVLWTLLVEAWLYGNRIPAVLNAGWKTIPTTKPEFDKRMPDAAKWAADNYNHLHEQPTCFYFILIVLVAVGAGTRENVLTICLAWVYVALRVVHSVVQTKWNHVETRLVVFIMSSAALLALTMRAIAETLL